jgi:hypothetical protein
MYQTQGLITTTLMGMHITLVDQLPKTTPVPILVNRRQAKQLGLGPGLFEMKVEGRKWWLRRIA